VTRRERFLAEMDAVIPWNRLMARIEPHYPKAGAGRQPLGLEKMLRIYFLQQWFNLSRIAIFSLERATHPATRLLITVAIFGVARPRIL